MGSKLDWRSLVPGCFAGITASFGSHPNDCRRAEQMFHQAMREGASLEDIIAEAQRHLVAQRSLPEEIKNQLRRIKAFPQNPYKITRSSRAWLVTWESHDGQPPKVQAILNARRSPEWVRNYIEQIYIDTYYTLHEKLIYAKNRDANPLPAKYDHSGDPLKLTRITCGGDPFLLARFVTKLSLRRAEGGEEHLAWEEAPATGPPLSE